MADHNPFANLAVGSVELDKLADIYHRAVGSPLPHQITKNTEIFKKVSYTIILLYNITIYYMTFDRQIHGYGTIAPA